MADKEAVALEEERIYIGSPGIVALSVCAPKDVARERVEEWANTESPTGISSRWAISDDAFADGSANPCPCDLTPETRLHYLLNC